MPLSYTDYRKLMADPKRSEAAQRGAATRRYRETLHKALMKHMWDRGLTGSEEEKLVVINELGGPFLELLGTRWAK